MEQRCRRPTWFPSPHAHGIARVLYTLSAHLCAFMRQHEQQHVTIMMSRSTHLAHPAACRRVSMPSLVCLQSVPTAFSLMRYTSPALSVMSTGWPVHCEWRNHRNLPHPEKELCGAEASTRVKGACEGCNLKSCSQEQAVQALPCAGLWARGSGLRPTSMAQRLLDAGSRLCPPPYPICSLAGGFLRVGGWWGGGVGWWRGVPWWGAGGG